MTPATSNLLGAMGALALIVVIAFPARAEVDGPIVASIEQAAKADAAATTEPAEAPRPQLVARIDLSDQRMYVYVDEMLVDVFKVSTARKGYVTPTGRYRAQWLSRYHRSRKYDWAPMPYSVFFHGGYAVHGTTDLKRLGRPASHGCVRLHPANAKTFFNLVKVSGKENTLISVVR
jgi:lipoprotein-anchoring transpeptidase ErfK/SrfK